MNLPWGRKKSEARQDYIGQWPSLPLGSISWGGSSYQEVDAVSGENSLQSVAFRAGADLIASLVSELPVDMFAGKGPTKQERALPSWLEDPAGDGYGLEDWIYQLIMSWILRGNAYGNILDQGPTGMLRQVDLMHPDAVSSRLEGGRAVWTVQGKVIPNDRIMHKRVNPVPGRLLGLSAVQSHADTLGLSITTTRFGVSWFQDGGHPGGLLSNSEADLNDENAVRTVKDRFMAALFGSREPLVLGRGWKYEQIQIAPEESQFLQTQQWSAAECARIHGPGIAEILGYETGGSMTYATVVDRDIEALKYTVGKWIRRVERVLTAFTSRPTYIKLNRDALLETNAMQRWAKYKIELDTGAATINEIREREDELPVEWGNEPMAIKAAEAAKPPADPNQPPADPGQEEK